MEEVWVPWSPILECGMGGGNTGPPNILSSNRKLRLLLRQNDHYNILTLQQINFDLNLKIRARIRKQKPDLHTEEKGHIPHHQTGLGFVGKVHPEEKTKNGYSFADELL